jgi:hypothetical protein
MVIVRDDSQVVSSRRPRGSPQPRTCGLR